MKMPNIPFLEWHRLSHRSHIINNIHYSTTNFHFTDYFRIRKNDSKSFTQIEQWAKVQNYSTHDSNNVVLHPRCQFLEWFMNPSTFFSSLESTVLLLAVWKLKLLLVGERISMKNVNKTSRHIQKLCAVIDWNGISLKQSTWYRVNLWMIVSGMQ